MEGWKGALQLSPLWNRLGKRLLTLAPRSNAGGARGLAPPLPFCPVFAVNMSLTFLPLLSLPLCLCLSLSVRR